MDYRVKKLKDIHERLDGSLFPFSLDADKTEDQEAAIIKTKATINELEANIELLNKAYLV